MRMRRLLLSLALFPFIYNARTQDIKINEMVVDPQQDHNKSGAVTDSDEYFELYNASTTNTYNLNGWVLELIDTTPVTKTLTNVVLAPRRFYVIQNPVGAQNNNGEVMLWDSQSNLVDRISYGNWEGATITNGNASSLLNESLSRYPDGSTNWIKTLASYGRENNPPATEMSVLSIFSEGQQRERTRINVEGLAGKTFVLQTSDSITTNANWTNISTNKAPFSYTNSTAQPRRFYRALEYTN